MPWEDEEGGGMFGLHGAAASDRLAHTNAAALPSHCALQRHLALCITTDAPIRRPQVGGSAPSEVLWSRGRDHLRMTTGGRVPGVSDAAQRKNKSDSIS
jgi:hypothetical protein